MTAPQPSPSPNAGGDRPSNLQEIKRKSVRGGAITVVTQAGTIGLHIASTIVMARVLGPAEYGVIAMVTAVTGFAGMFRDLGLSSASVQRSKLSEEQLSTLFWINVSMGLLLTIIVAAASPLVALFYGRQELTLVTLCLSSTFLIGSFGVQAGALLTRRMQFGYKSIATLSGLTINMIVTVALALHDYAYWSLVFGTISGALVTTVLLCILSGWRPGPPVRGSGVRSMLKYGANITGFEMVNYFHRNLDNMLIGRFWGSDALGLYNRAYQLLMFPITNLRTPINAVAFPALSQLQNQPEQFRLYYRKITKLLAFATMPVTAFMFVGAAPFINLALGSKWKEVTPLFSILAIVSFIQPVASLRGLVLQSLGQGRRYLNWGIINAVAVSIGFLIGVHWGSRGVAISYCISVYLILYPSMSYVFKGTPVSFVDFTEAISQPFVASILAVAATELVLYAFPIEQANSIAQICVIAPVFLTTYLLGFAVLPGGKSELTKLLSLARSGFKLK